MDKKRTKGRQGTKDKARRCAAAGSPPSVERGPAKATMDARDMEVIRGMVNALAAYTYATPGLIVRALTGILWLPVEAEQIFPENVQGQRAGAEQESTSTND